MVSEPRARLFADEARQRFFLIPAGVAILPGALALVSVSGAERLDADPAAVEPFEVTRAEATEHLRQGLEDVLVRAQDAVSEAVARWSAGPLEERPPAQASTPPGPGLALLAELAGARAEALQDPERLTEALQGLGAQAGDFLASLLDPRREAGDQAAAGAARLQALLSRHGLEVPGSLPEVTEGVREALVGPEAAEVARAAAERLESAASAVDGAAARLGAWLEELAERMRREAEAAEGDEAP